MSEKLSGALAENLLTLIAFSEKSCALVRASVEPQLFSSSMYRDIVQRCYDYFDRYSKPPGQQHLPDLMEDMLSKGDNNSRLCEDILNSLFSQYSAGMNEEYIVSQLESFVRMQKLKIGVAKATESLADGDPASAEVELQKALETSLQLFSPGLTLEAGLEKALHKTRIDILTLGIEPLDRHNLGPARKELMQFIAPPKRGKTWFLVHCAKRALMQRLNTVYVTLEISEELIWQRMMQSLFAIQRKRTPLEVTRVLSDDLGRLVKLERDRIHDRLALDDKGIRNALQGKLSKIHGRENLIIKGFPTGMLTVNGLRAYLDALQRMMNFTPDCLIIDYPDLMSVDTDNFRLELGQILVGIRGLCVQRNMMGIVAKKSNRAGAAARVVTAEHSGEDYSGAFTVDTTFTYTQTMDENKLGLARLFVDSTRVGDADKFLLLLSQAYSIGQFVLPGGVVSLTDTYWSHVSSMLGGMGGSTDATKQPS